jgi:hypothetical protein
LELDSTVSTAIGILPPKNRFKMASGGIIDVGNSAAQSIGRYFSVISVVPSSLYVTFVYVLITSGSWQRSPNWSHAFRSLEQLGVGGIAFLAFLSVAIGAVIHPSQFAIVQFFEGYWGNAPLAQYLRSRRILRYQRLCESLGDKHAQLSLKLSAPGVDALADRTPLLSRIAEAERARNSFPLALRNVMPTRLGNVLRRAESQAGSQYGLDALQAVPHLLQIAPPGQVDYVNDQRTQLDLAIRMTFMSGLACGTAVLFLCHRHFWVLIAFIPYMLAYLSYRGSVIAADHYGSALDTLINLNRFELYKQLHLKLPEQTEAERDSNKELARLFEFDDSVVVRYEHPPASSTGDQGS